MKSGLVRYTVERVLSFLRLGNRTAWKKTDFINHIKERLSICLTDFISGHYGVYLGCRHMWSNLCPLRWSASEYSGQYGANVSAGNDLVPILQVSLNSAGSQH